MHEFPKKSSIANRLRRIMLGLCLAVLIVSLCLIPATQMQEAIAAPETFDCGNVTEIPQVECEALVALYESTNGPNWTIPSAWLDTNTPCSWYGVFCESGTITGLGPMDWWYECGRTYCSSSMNLTGSIPPEIGNLNNLIVLDLHDNQLDSLPPEIGNLTKLESLDLERNVLTSLPAEIGNLTNLEDFNLRYNELTNLPIEIGNLVQLSHMALDENQLSSLPAEIGNLINLPELDLSYNKLTNLPSEIGSLTNLTGLYLDSNQLNDLPIEIFNLNRLEALTIAGNRLTNIPTQISNLTHLTNLILSYNQLTDLPSEIGNLTNLTGLNLESNKLTNLPVEIGNLTKLYALDLTSNLLTNLPREFGNLSGLVFLYLSENQLSSLPPEIGSLTNLVQIFLENNQLSSLPPEIGNLHQLLLLLLNDNLLTSLPTEIGNLSKLDYLDLSNNQLSSLPPEFANLSKLYELDLSYNRLTINDPYLLNFLRRFYYFPDWMDTQTVAPLDFRLRSATPLSLTLAWSPIQYTSDGGYYEISYATNPSGPFAVHGTTANKTNDDYLAGSLPVSTTYYVRIRTFSQAHDDQLHDLWSEYSPTVAVLNTPIDPVFGATLNYTNEQDLTTQVEVPPGAVSGSETLYFSTQTGARLPFKFASTGQIFNLGLYQPRGYTDDLLLSSPITLTLDYDDSHWIEENLELIFWDSTANTWIDATQTCSPAGMYDRHPDENRLVVTACRLGKYALVEVRSASYLPIVYQDKGYLP
jgi:Leucine-rich repeat (LRR) protein